MTPPVPPTPPTAPDVSDIVNRIFSSSNWRGEIEKTVRKNVRLQEKLRLQQATLDKIGAKINLDTGEPKEGRLLTKEEAVQYTAFIELKIKPEDLKKVVDEHGKLKEKQAERDAEEQFQTAAEALEFENVPALTRWLTREGLVLEFKDQRVDEEQEDGSVKKVTKKMPYVRPKADDKATVEPLEDYIEREVPEFVSVFRAKPEEGDGEEEEMSSGSESAEDFIQSASREALGRVGKGKSGTRFPVSRGAGGEPSTSRDRKVLEKMEEDARGSHHYRL